jgi:hypothetical protein
METTAFFEKKLSLTPSDFNKVKTISIDELLTTKACEMVENKCSEQGFVLPGSVKLISRSMGYFESARFTGDAIYYVKLEAKVIYPADGIKVSGKVIRKNKMGLYIDYKNAIRIQVPRDLHLGNEDYDAVEIGDSVLIELKRSKFAINDAYILASGIYIEHEYSAQYHDNNAKNAKNNGVKEGKVKEEEEEEEEAGGEEAEAEGEDEEAEAEGEEEAEKAEEAEEKAEEAEEAEEKAEEAEEEPEEAEEAEEEAEEEDED